MGVTKIDELSAPQARIKVVASLPTTPAAYYGVASNDVDSVTWRGGEMAYMTTDNRLYIQYETSGTSATWKRHLDKFVTY